MGHLLSASVATFDEGATVRPWPIGLNATPVPLFSRGPSRRAGLSPAILTAPGMSATAITTNEKTTRDGPTASVAWALELTALTTAAPVPGALPAT